MKRNYLLTKGERLALQEKLRTEYLSGTWSTQHEAALRHGVPDSIVSSLIKKIKLQIEETVKEQREDEVARTLLQIERMIGRALEAFEISRKKRVRCLSCGGAGRDKDEKMCERCEGEGWIEEVRPGNPVYLQTVLKALEQKQRIFGMQPQRSTTRIGQMLLVGGQPVDSQNPLLGAPPDVLIRARRLLLELKERGNGEVLDAEFTEKKKEEENDADA